MRRMSHHREGHPYSAWSKAPCTHRNISLGSREIPGLALTRVGVRAVNLKRERRR